MSYLLTCLLTNPFFVQEGHNNEAFDICVLLKLKFPPFLSDHSFFHCCCCCFLVHPLRGRKQVRDKLAAEGMAPVDQMIPPEDILGRSYCRYSGPTRT